MSTFISLWSGPRNISTTLMYSFAQRNDTMVVDEPLYAHYLSNSPARFYHPGADKILSEQNNNGNKVLQNLLEQNEYPVYFLKNMTHHFIDLNHSFLSKMNHILLIRDPREVLLSYSKVIDKIEIKDVGYKKQLELKNLLEEKQIPFLVLDAKQVLLQPERQLRTVCKFVDLDFQESMLSWEKGAIPEDGSWAKYWYSSVHNSTGFKPYKEKTERLPEDLLPLYEKCDAIYQKIRNIAVD